MPGLTPLQQSEVTFLSGVNANGTLASVSYWTWDDNAPATYNSNYQSKYGGATAGTSGRILYSFDTASRWTDTEKGAFRSAMALWSAVANVTFVEVQSGSFADSSLIISRGSDGGASGGADDYIPGRIGTTTLGVSTGSAEISIDTSVPGFGPIGSTLSNYGGYPWTTIIHELGHVIGLGHGGAYNDGDTTEDPQFTQFDSLAYSLMSYNDDPNVDWGTARGDNGNFYGRSPVTPMMLDIAAAQQLYGLPTSTPLDGGDVFGFNTTITGSLNRFYDFSQNTSPVVTIWDAGTGNTLDLTGSAGNQTVDLRQGSFSSVLGLTNNLAIAYGARINTLLLSGGDDIATANDDGDTINAGNGYDTLIGGAGDDTLNGGASTGVTNDGTPWDIFVGNGGSDRILADSTHYTEAQYAGIYRQYGVSFSSIGQGSARSSDGYATGGPEGGQDHLTGIADLQFRDGDLVVWQQGSAAEVYRLYDAILGRAPDAYGLDAWTDALNSGSTLVQVAAAFTGSTEFTNATGNLSNGDFVEYLYVHALGRASDPNGKQGWVQTLDSGTSRASVALSFSESGEHIERTADAIGHGLFVTNQDYQEVAALYDSFANRRPDIAGLESWAGALESGQLTLRQVAADFAGSAEFAGRTNGFTNGQLVDFMYQNALDRAADPGGYASWTGALNNGLSRGDLLLAFSQSVEHVQLITPDITNGIATI